MRISQNVTQSSHDPLLKAGMVGRDTVVVSLFREGERIQKGLNARTSLSARNQHENFRLRYISGTQPKAASKPANVGAEPSLVAYKLRQDIFEAEFANEIADLQRKGQAI